jgi:hypothetical protein
MIFNFSSVSALSLLILVFSNQVFSFDISKFKSEISKANLIYEDFQLNQANTLIVQGQMSIANEQIENLVDDKSFYDYFILSNMLFSMDPDSSYAYMKKAEKIKPNHPFVLYERGIHEHRLNNYKAAGEYYHKFLNSKFGKDHTTASAYMTHTNLMTNKIEESFISWEKANFSSNHTRIEKAMYPIFSHLNQDKKREQIIIDINNGQAFKLCDLWSLDLNWETDWWNKGPRNMYLEFDKELTAKVLKEFPEEKPFTDFCSDSENLSKDNIMSYLAKIGIDAENKNLPQSSALIYNILLTTMRNNLMSEQEFLSIFEEHLQQLSKKHPNDPAYLKTLAYLYNQTKNKDKLNKVNLLGWKEHNISNYAVSYISEIEDSNQLESYLNEALKDFPNDATLNQYYMAMYGPKDKQAIARFAASQFSNVQYNWMGKYRLGDYMSSLKYEIEKLASAGSE